MHWHVNSHWQKKISRLRAGSAGMQFVSQSCLSGSPPLFVTFDSKKKNSLALLLSSFFVFKFWHAIMKSYTFKEATTRNELDAVVDLVWKAQYNPYDPSFSAFFPVFGPTAGDREAAIKKSKDRLWQSHQSDSSSHWIYVEDPSTGEVVGATEWELYETNPFPEGPPKMEASWWPEGEGRNFCNEILRQCYAPRHRWLTRPHLGQLALTPQAICRRY